jgi:hypothetical protein
MKYIRGASLSSVHCCAPTAMDVGLCGVFVNTITAKEHNAKTTAEQFARRVCPTAPYLNRRLQALLIAILTNAHTTQDTHNVRTDRHLQQKGIERSTHVRVRCTHCTPQFLS